MQGANIRIRVKLEKRVNFVAPLCYTLPADPNAPFKESVK